MEQGTPEWFKVRELKLTASNAQAIGTNGKGLETLVTELMAEYLSSAPRENYTNKDMERGKELETVARSMYELQEGVVTQQVGFVEESEHVGASPDGFVNEDGMMEIKCPNDVGHYRIMRDGEKEIDTKYIWQSQMALLVTGRKWCDIVIYNPNFEKSMLIFRQTPDKVKHAALEAGIKAGVEMIKKQLKQQKNGTKSNNQKKSD